MNTQIQLKTAFEGIDLDHMRLEIDLGETVRKDGPESARNTAIWLTQQFFWDHPSMHDGSVSRSVMMDVLDQAKFLATNYLFNDWEELGERAKIFLLSEIQQRGWHSSKYFNFQNLEEYLSNVLETQTSKVGISTWKFVIEQLLPAAARYGIDPGLLYGVKAQIRKLRELVPVARKILSDPSLSEVMKEQYLKHFIEKAADPKVKHAAYKIEADRFRNRKSRVIERLVGYECIMPNRETWIIIRCPREIDERIVEMLLGTKVDLRVTDWRAFTGLVAAMLDSAGDLSLEDRQHLIPKLIHILEGRTYGEQWEEGTDQPSPST